MNASEQARRTILSSCKYQRKTAVIQHKDAKKLIAESITNGKLDVNTLRGKLGIYEGKITDTPFEEDVKQHNIDYVNSVLTMGFDGINGEEFDIVNSNKKLILMGRKYHSFQIYLLPELI